MHPDPKRIMDLSCAYYDSCVLFAANDLGVFPALDRLGRADAETLAKELSADPRGLSLLLNAAVAAGLLVKQDGIYANAPDTAAFLVPGKPGDLSRAINYNRDVLPAWSRLAQLAKTGKPVEKPSLHLGEDQNRTRTFVYAMHFRALGIGRALVHQMDLSKMKKLLDIGGGPGTYSVLLAQKNPDLTSTVMDLPEVAAIASELIASQNMSERVKAIPGDYHTAEFPQGQDAVAILGVLHQENPEAITAVFKKAFQCLNPGGKIFVMDMMCDKTHTNPKFSAMFAVNMALTTENGWVFSDEELSGWLAQAGFEDISTTPLPPPMPHWLTSARKKG
ncbi:MAG: methyltransferase [Thermodesulfobacteriota bacterium]